MLASRTSRAKRSELLAIRQPDNSHIFQPVQLGRALPVEHALGVVVEDDDNVVLDANADQPPDEIVEVAGPREGIVLAHIDEVEEVGQVGRQQRQGMTVSSEPLKLLLRAVVGLGSARP